MTLPRNLVAAAATTAVAFAFGAPAEAHRSGCHRQHSCPSDHATYKWRSKLCVKPSSDQRDSSFRKKVRYDGKTYYCKNA